MSNPIALLTVRNGTIMNGTGRTLLTKNEISTSADRNVSMIHIMGPVAILPSQDAPIISACRNFVNERECGIFKRGVGNTQCIPPANLVSGGNVYDCTATASSSTTRTTVNSHSSTIQSTLTTTPSNTHIPTDSPTKTSSASSVPSASATITATLSQTSTKTTSISISRSTTASFPCCRRRINIHPRWWCGDGCGHPPRR